MAAVASPVMGPISDAIVATLGDTILVEMGVHAGFEATTKVANDLILDKAVNAIIPIHSKTFETTGIKEILITLKYKQTMTDASLGFYRSSVHKYHSALPSDPRARRLTLWVQEQLALLKRDGLFVYGEGVVLAVLVRERAKAHHPALHDA